jgi:hypothetical protein
LKQKEANWVYSGQLERCSQKGVEELS